MEDKMKYFNVDRNKFDPWDYVKKGDNKDYLPITAKKAWFRSVYPQGNIRYKLLEKKENYVLVEARVYCNRTDPEDQYIGYGLSFATFEQVYANEFQTPLERNLGMQLLANGKAAARALTDAGFGLQFYIDEPDPDEESAPETESAQNCNAAVPPSPVPPCKSPQPANVSPSGNKVKSSEPDDKSKETAGEKSGLTSEMDPAAEYASTSCMDLEKALAMKVDCGKGFNKNNPDQSFTLGELLDDNKGTHLSWLFVKTKSADLKSAIKTIVESNEKLQKHFASKKLR